MELSYQRATQCGLRQVKEDVPQCTMRAMRVPTLPIQAEAGY